MGRGRGKGKKQSAIGNLEDPGNVDEENLPIYRRRGRPQKLLKDETEEEEEVTEKMEEDGENIQNNAANIDISSDAVTAVTENGKKRKSSLLSRAKTDLSPEGTGVQAKPIADDSTKSAGFRKNGSRRKNKPRRAAEAGVDCK